MKLDTKLVIVAAILAVITSTFLPKIDPATVSERIATIASWVLMAMIGVALGLGHDRDGNKIVEKDFDPEA